MGRASNRKQQLRDIRASVTAEVTEIVTGDPDQVQPGKKGIVNKMKSVANGMKEGIRSKMGDEIIKGAIKLVKEDIKKGKVHNEEEYILKCKESLRPGTKAGNMIRNSGIAWEDMEAMIRQVLKENYAGKV